MVEERTVSSKSLREMVERLKEKPDLELMHKLKPYHCPICFKYIIEGKEGKDFITSYSIMNGECRFHLTCKKEYDERGKKFKRSLQEIDERIKRREYEVEHNLIPKNWGLSEVVHGLKKDYERFLQDLPRILKGYNIERVEEPMRKTRKIRRRRKIKR